MDKHFETASIDFNLIREEIITLLKKNNRLTNAKIIEVLLKADNTLRRISNLSKTHLDLWDANTIEFLEELERLASDYIDHMALAAIKVGISNME